MALSAENRQMSYCAAADTICAFIFWTTGKMDGVLPFWVYTRHLDKLEQKFQQFWNLLTNPELMIPILHIFMTKNILVTKGGTLCNFWMMGSQGQYKDLSYGLKTLHGYGVLEWENLQSPFNFSLFYILNHPTVRCKVYIGYLVYLYLFLHLLLYL